MISAIRAQNSHHFSKNFRFFEIGWGSHRVVWEAEKMNNLLVSIACRVVNFFVVKLAF